MCSVCTVVHSRGALLLGEAWVLEPGVVGQLFGPRFGFGDDDGRQVDDWLCRVSTTERRPAVLPGTGWARSP